jgi:hypothetical protein
MAASAAPLPPLLCPCLPFLGSLLAATMQLQCCCNRLFTVWACSGTDLPEVALQRAQARKAHLPGPLFPSPSPVQAAAVQEAAALKQQAEEREPLLATCKMEGDNLRAMVANLQVLRPPSLTLLSPFATQSISLGAQAAPYVPATLIRC